ncbi:Ripening-related protein grip22 [Linum grandiflorum]
MTINGFQKGQDGGGPSECDGKYHSNNQKIVALSSHWYHGRCGKCIRIKWRGKSTTAKVVDECDTSGGCKTNIVDASKAVWNSLGIKKGSSQFGETGVTWEEC